MMKGVGGRSLEGCVAVGGRTRMVIMALATVNPSAKVKRGPHTSMTAWAARALYKARFLTASCEFAPMKGWFDTCCVIALKAKGSQLRYFSEALLFADCARLSQHVWWKCAYPTDSCIRRRSSLQSPFLRANEGDLGPHLRCNHSGRYV